MKLLFALFLAGLFYLIQARVYKRMWSDHLEINIAFDRQIVYEQEENALREVIANQKYLPLPILQVKFSLTRTFLFEKEENTSVTDNYYRNEFFTVMPMQKITRTYPFVCSHRGYFRMDSMDVICRGFFLTDKMVEQWNHTAGVCVLPARIPRRAVPAGVSDLMGDIEKKLHLIDDPFTFAGIREYQPYDSQSSINWKSTARVGNLMVNTYNTSFSKKVVLLVNLEANGMLHRAELAEWVIRIAANLADYHIKARIPTALYTNGWDLALSDEGAGAASGPSHTKDLSPKEAGCAAVEAGGDMAHIRNIEIALARLDTGRKSASFIKLLEERVERGAGVEYIIISNDRKPDLTEKYLSLREEGCNIHFILPEYRNPGIEDQFKNGAFTEWIIED